MSNLSNAELVNCFNRLMKNETVVTVSLLEYLGEIEERKLYLEEGYSSMFDWMHNKYKYSRGAAWRRIKSAMAMRQYPMLKDLLLSRELNITTLSSLANHLTAENALSRIEMCRGKTEREIEQLVALFDAESENSNTVINYKGNKVRKEKVKVIAVKKDAPSCKAENSKNLELFADFNSVKSSEISESAECAEISDIADGNAAKDGQEVSSGDEESSSKPEFVYRIVLTADQELFDQLEELRINLSTKLPRGSSYSELIKHAVVSCNKAMCKQPKTKSHSGKLETIALKDTSSVGSPKAEQNLETDQNPEIGQKVDQIEAQDQMVGQNVPHILGEVEQLVTEMRITKKGKVPNTAAKHSRYIPKKVAAEVRARDGNCCSFVGKDGKRCSSQWDLEIDHIVPHCLGGANEPSNLQLLCRAHNCHRAEQMFGKEFVQKKSKQS